MKRLGKLLLDSFSNGLAIAIIVVIILSLLIRASLADILISIIIIIFLWKLLIKSPMYVNKNGKKNK